MSDRPPDAARAIEKYRRRAHSYDHRTRPIEALRRAAVQRLLIRPGDTVIDLGCGTGSNFEMLDERVGPNGRIVGVDLSGDMLAAAENRISQRDWDNITLIESPVEDAEISRHSNAALFSFTHDILQSNSAIENVLSALASGGRVASVGAKWAPRWRLPVNLATWFIARQYVTTFAGFDRPWAKLERRVANLTVHTAAFGGAYIAWGSVRTPEDERNLDR